MGGRGWVFVSIYKLHITTVTNNLSTFVFSFATLFPFVNNFTYFATLCFLANLNEFILHVKMIHIWVNLTRHNTTTDNWLSEPKRVQSVNFRSCVGPKKGRGLVYFVCLRSTALLPL